MKGGGFPLLMAKNRVLAHKPHLVADWSDVPRSMITLSTIAKALVRQFRLIMFASATLTYTKRPQKLDFPWEVSQDGVLFLKRAKMDDEP